MSQYKISKLSREKFEEAGQLMARAFQEEGIIGTLFRLSTPARVQRMGKAFQLRLALHDASGQPILMACNGPDLMGIAVVSTSDTKPNVAKLLKILFPGLLKLLPLLFMLRYSYLRAVLRALKKPAELPHEYCTLEAIAVGTEHQGRGVGKQLLEAVNRCCAEEKGSRGIYLITGDEKNKQLYSKKGYEVLCIKKETPFILYHMFRDQRT